MNLNCPDEHGNRLIHYMCMFINLDMVKCLVENGADINCVNYLGYRPIHLACMRFDEALEIVKFLVANGANVNCTDFIKRRPIHIVCHNGDKALELVKCLVANGDKSANLVNFLIDLVKIEFISLLIKKWTIVVFVWVTMHRQLSLIAA